MKDLTSTTLLIPIKIDSKDRCNNLLYNLCFLNANLKINVFIYEEGNYLTSIKNDLIQKYKNINFKFFTCPKNIFFHRTKYINEMLDFTETPVVCVYDIDIIFDPEIYFKSQQEILNDEYDMIYPYAKGYFQVDILKQAKKEVFLKELSIQTLFSSQSNFINFSPFILKYCEYGHAIFFNTKKYQNAGGENENFLSWGPEDQERYFKFNQLKFKIKWQNNTIIHFDHERTPDSDYTNPHYKNNDLLFDKIKKMTREEFIQYYKNADYYKKYKNIKFQFN